MANNDVIGLIVLLSVVLLAVLAEWHRRSSNRRIEEAERQQRVSEAEHAAREAAEHRRVTTLKEARERARLAFPDLLEADGVRVPDPPPISESDKALVEQAYEIVREEIAELEAAHPLLRMFDDESYSSTDPVKKRWYALRGELNALVTTGHEGPPYEDPAPFLVETPARIIDCGEAGHIELFDPAQVAYAMEASGADDYVEFLERCARAPDAARTVMERTNKKREAEEAHLASITTRFEDLPPLPNSNDPKNNR